jgi:hypothetical protein
MCVVALVHACNPAECRSFLVHSGRSDSYQLSSALVSVWSMPLCFLGCSICHAQNEGSNLGVWYGSCLVAASMALCACDKTFLDMFWISLGGSF